MNTEQKFEIFHTTNPHIYDMLVDLARRMRAKKTMQQWSIYAAYELLRYQWNCHTRTFDEYKLPNEYRPLYSRLIMQQESDLAGFFRTKGSDNSTAVDDGHGSLIEFIDEIME